MSLNFAKRLLWFTDTHLNYWPGSKHRLVEHVHRESPSGVIISGDISSGTNLRSDLTFLAKNVLCPIYIVCGNHDAWFLSFDKMRNIVRSVADEFPNLIWLSDRQEVKISDDTCFIGEDGWYDCGVGNPIATLVTGDWLAIKELRSWPFSNCLKRFRELAQNSVEKLEAKLELVLERFKTVYLVTHVPPWSTDEDKASFFKHYFLPYNANIRLGKMIEAMMAKPGYTDNNLIVLSGHCHVKSKMIISNNIMCMVGRHGVRKPQLLLM